ncbi:MAG: 4Fe-4S binding protein, partial [Bacteroidales bacterium]|nr:4Fe-4S binding protein [Bacteroidales bacterium]
KKGRVLVSVLFFLAFYAIFTDFANLAPVWFINAATYLQFAPSVLQWIHLLSFASAGFIIVIVLTLLFGRVYCSTVCPLGTLQDLIIYIHRKINRKRRFRYLKPDRILRYGFLILTVAGVIIGTTLLVNLLDPYSLFGKVTVTLARPVVIGVNNLVSGILESMNLQHGLPGWYLTWADFQDFPFQDQP